MIIVFIVASRRTSTPGVLGAQEYCTDDRTGGKLNPLSRYKILFVQKAFEVAGVRILSLGHDFSDYIRRNDVLSVVVDLYLRFEKKCFRRLLMRISHRLCR